MTAAGSDLGEDTGAGAASGHDAVDARLLFRAVNERISDLNASFTSLLALGEWVCECPDRGCFERIALTPAEFEAVRTRQGHFAVKRGHEPAVGGRIVESCDRYAVVATESEAASEEPRNAPAQSPHRRGRRVPEPATPA
jgi:hypothetical protein